MFSVCAMDRFRVPKCILESYYDTAIVTDDAIEFLSVLGYMYLDIECSNASIAITLGKNPKFELKETI